jgi:hypothetical protein
MPDRNDPIDAERLTELAARTPEGNYHELSERYAGLAQEERRRDPGTADYYQSLSEDYATLAERDQERLPGTEVCQGILVAQDAIREALTPREDQPDNHNHTVLC